MLKYFQTVELCLFCWHVSVNYCWNTRHLHCSLSKVITSTVSETGVTSSRGNYSLILTRVVAHIRLTGIVCILAFIVDYSMQMHMIERLEVYNVSIRTSKYLRFVVLFLLVPNICWILCSEYLCRANVLLVYIYSMGVYAITGAW